MIENNSELVEQLWRLPGREVAEVIIDSLPIGQTICIETRKNQYLLEVTDPRGPQAHVVRRYSGGHIPQAGYLGQKYFSRSLKLNYVALFGGFGITTPIVRIVLFGD